MTETGSNSSEERLESDAIILRDGFELGDWMVGVVSVHHSETQFELKCLAGDQAATPESIARFRYWP